jgi:hypothetical protein
MSEGGTGRGEYGISRLAKSAELKVSDTTSTLTPASDCPSLTFGDL